MELLGHIVELLGDSPYPRPGWTSIQEAGTGKDCKKKELKKSEKKKKRFDAED